MITGARINGRYILSDKPESMKIEEVRKMQLLRMGYY